MEHKDKHEIVRFVVCDLVTGEPFFECWFSPHDVVVNEENPRPEPGAFFVM